jgi:hypothetical protein
MQLFRYLTREKWQLRIVSEFCGFAQQAETRCTKAELVCSARLAPIAMSRERLDRRRVVVPHGASAHIIAR